MEIKALLDADSITQRRALREAQLASPQTTETPVLPQAPPPRIQRNVARDAVKDVVLTIETLDGDVVVPDLTESADKRSHIESVKHEADADLIVYSQNRTNGMRRLTPKSQAYSEIDSEFAF